MSRTPYLLSKTLDPALGVFTGVFAYFLHENNPRTAPSSLDLRLTELVKWKAAKRAHHANEKEEEEALQALAEVMKAAEAVVTTEGAQSSSST